MKAKILLTISSLLALTNFAFAENIAFQNIRVGGTGCPSDVTSIVTAPDLSSASIIFQSFESRVPAVVTNPKATPYISILNCNVFLDLKLPSGVKLDALEISYDMRGSAFLEKGVSGSFKSFLMSSAGMGTDRTQKNQLLQEKSWLNTSMDQEEDFLVRSSKTLPINSGCGMGSRNDLVTVHLQHQLASQIMRGYERTSAAGTIVMDSSDLTGGIRISTRVSACRGGPVNGGGNNGRNCRVTRVNGRAVTVCD